MNQAEHISIKGRHLLDRRNFMRSTGMTFGGLGLAQLLAAEDKPNFTGKVSIRPQIDPDHPYAPRKPHFPMPAKKVLVIFCPGAVSHVDTFDYKPMLDQAARQEATEPARSNLRRTKRQHREAVLGFQTTRTNWQDGF